MPARTHTASASQKSPGKISRAAIIEKKKEVARFQAHGVLGPKDNATFLIKPDDNSTYEDLVSILDEMAISDARVYAVVDITPQDREFVRMTEDAGR